MIKILIVDDEAASVKIIQEFISFEEYGLYLSGIAENGIEAMRHLNSPDCPDIVITDMNMPAMDGVSLLQYLIDFHPNIKIIVISGYYDFEYTHAAIKANVHDYLLKPISYEKLNAAVRNCCQEIRNSKKLSVDSKSQKVQVDLKIYQTILKHSNHLKEILEYGEVSSLNAEISSLQKVVTSQDTPEVLYSLVYKTLTESLLLFCIERNYPTPEIPDYENIRANSAKKKCPGYDNEIFQILNSLYLQCLEQIHEQRKSSSSYAILEQVKQYILNHYRENISLDEVADIHFIDKEYLATLFRSKYDETVGGYIISLKIDDAKRQLKYTDRKIDDIAASLGYLDSSYFSRQFKKSTGLSPGRYRSRQNKER